jgi:uncharacterized protein
VSTRARVRRVPWKRALVTGSSAGIGTALARDLAGRGVDLVLVARNGERLEKLAAELRGAHRVEVEVLPADLGEATSRDQVVRRLAAEPAIDLLVNNAGIGTFGVLANLDIEGELGLIEVNVVAPVVLAKAAIDRMKTAGHGSVLTISSLDGLQPTPNHASYGASKAFVNSFFEAVHQELRGSGVTVTTVMPGYVPTEFTQRAGIENALEGVPRFMILDPARVARDSVDGAAAGKAKVVPGAIYQVSAVALGATPTAIGRRIFARLAPPVD